MENCFTYYQRCKSKNCTFYSSFCLILDFYDDNGNCVLQETQKRLYSFTCKECKMLTFFYFKLAATEKCVVYLKQRQVLIKDRRKIHKEKIKWEEKKE